MITRHLHRKRRRLAISLSGTAIRNLCESEADFRFERQFSLVSFRLPVLLRNGGRYFAAGVASVDTGGEFHLPACLAVVRRSRAGRTAARKPHLISPAHESPQCPSILHQTSRSPTRPGASRTSPSPKALSASACASRILNACRFPAYSATAICVEALV